MSTLTLHQSLSANYFGTKHVDQGTIMRAEQVQAFIDVTEHGSFAAAARHTGMKRSTLSAAVNALEDSLGVALFERSGNSLQLTAVGESVLPDCYRLLTSANRINKHCQQHLQGVESQLCIARDDALPEAFWRQVMHDLKQRYPLTAISVYLLPPKSTPSSCCVKRWISPLGCIPPKGRR
ncbi:LysR family transcriptional regulator [Vreelandella aquamarina]|uniref:LysR family transcriptional regulator n=1 Tax=Vreelandella aquamarina TaxID=77097 RepID=UPI0020C2620C|nr:LysR family transcriptional regulator [Halomonas meridiana]